MGLRLDGGGAGQNCIIIYLVRPRVVYTQVFMNLGLCNSVSNFAFDTYFVQFDLELLKQYTIKLALEMSFAIIFEILYTLL